jgi:hypothetical protein
MKAALEGSPDAFEQTIGDALDPDRESSLERQESERRREIELAAAREREAERRARESARRGRTGGGGRASGLK